MAKLPPRSGGAGGQPGGRPRPVVRPPQPSSAAKPADPAKAPQLRKSVGVAGSVKTAKSTKPPATTGPTRPRRIGDPAIKIERRSARLAVKAQLSQLRAISGGSPLRRGVVYTSIGAITLLVALVLATIFTPMMAIEKIDIVGLKRLKQTSVYESVKGLIGTPLTLVDENQIQKRLANFSLIESFTTVSLPPHTLQLFIQERQPIGYVDIGATHYLYDPAGVQIGPTNTTANYPHILLNGDPSHSSSYREAVSVLLALPVALYPNVASIQATSVDDVRIHLRGVANQQILWGDSSDSVLKSKVLTALMANVKRNASVVLDVSSPTAPTVRYGNF